MSVPGIITASLVVSALLSGCGGGGGDASNNATDSGDSFTFGLFSDPHYAAAGCRASVGYCYNQTERMTSAMAKMKTKGAQWVALNGDNKDENVLPDFYANQTKSRAACLTYLASIKQTLETDFAGKIVHVLGNHDMDRLTKAEVLETLQEASGHYVRSMTASLSAVVLDGTYDQAGQNFSTMSCQDPGTGCTVGAGAWQNATIPADQIAWLQKTLTQLKTEKKRAVVFSHFRLDADKSNTFESTWLRDRTLTNSGEVRAVLEQFKSTVLVVFHGHDHIAQDAPRLINGIGYFTQIAMVGNDVIENTPYSMVTVWPKTCGVLVQGYGRVPMPSCPDSNMLCKNRTLVSKSVDWSDGALGGGGSCAWETAVIKGTEFL